MIGIICAMDLEVEAMYSHMENCEEKQYHGMTIQEGIIANHPVAVIKSGVGKVNAAMATTLLLCAYDCECVINVGVAGGLMEKQNVNDIVIARNVIQHDFDTSPIDGEKGLGLSYSCSEPLAQKLKHCAEAEGLKCWIGDIASGDVFVTTNHYYERIRKQFPSCVCAEMEAGAIAQVCANTQVDCLIIRTLSDVAAKEDNPIDFLTFVKDAAKRAGDICTKLLEMR